MRFGKIIVVVIIVAVVGFGIYNLFREKQLLDRETSELRAGLKKLEEENRFLLSRIEFLGEPENLLKEVKSQFNYREEGEGLIIIVPSTSTIR